MAHRRSIQLHYELKQRSVSAGFNASTCPSVDIDIDIGINVKRERYARREQEMNSCRHATPRCVTTCAVIIRHRFETHRLAREGPDGERNRFVLTSGPFKMACDGINSLAVVDQGGITCPVSNWVHVYDPERCFTTAKLCSNCSRHAGSVLHAFTYDPHRSASSERLCLTRAIVAWCRP